MRRMARSAQTFAAHGVDCVFPGSGHAYSVERLVAFRAYCAQTSRLRVLLVLTLTLSAPLLLLAACDVIPLQDPDAGWHANSGFWTLQRAFGISLFYRIAFTLEREWRLFQCNFVSWIFVVFQFLLLHNGADYSFEFRWMNGGSVFSHAEHNGTSTSTSASASSNA